MRASNSYSSRHEPATAPPVLVLFPSPFLPTLSSTTSRNMADGEQIESSSPKRARTATDDVAMNPTNLRAMIRDTVREVLREHREDEPSGPRTSPGDTPSHSGEFTVVSGHIIGPDESVWRWLPTTWWMKRQGRPAGGLAGGAPWRGRRWLARRPAKIAMGGAGPEGQ